MQPIIDISDYSYAIGGTTILDGVTLSAAEGEYLSIIGPNGAGKTTLLKCIIRIHTGGEGSISIAGKPLDGYSQRELAKLVSYVPQGNGRAAPFTIREYLMTGRYPHLSPFTSFTREDRSAVADALDITGITGLADRRLDTLSGGERQTAAIAAALVQGGRVMLLDEPTTFLDPRHESDILSLIATINRERGITVISVTHNINSAALHSDRIAILKRGHVVFHGPPEDVMVNDVLEDVYGRPFRIIDHPDGAGKIIIPETGKQ